MSYDLWFSAPQGRTLGAEAWRAYAARMPKTRWVDETRLLYENLDTGVYCAFDYTEPASDSVEDETGTTDTGLAFNLNYARPSFFALESMPLVKQVCADLDLLVIDPQAENESGPKPARADELIATWNMGNQFTSQQIAQYAAQGALAPEDQVSYLPPTRGLEWWDFRRRQARIKQQFSGAAEAALILVKPKKRAEAFRLLGWQPTDSVWLLPRCDLVHIVLRTAGIFGLGGRLAQVVVPWPDVAVALGELSRPLDSSDADIRVIDAHNLEEARRYVESMRGTPFEEYERVRPDHCIELELPQR
jgi:hypothetical protein